MSHMSQQAFPDQSPGYRNAPPAVFADPAAPADPDVYDVYDGLPLEGYPIPIVMSQDIGDSSVSGHR